MLYRPGVPATNGGAAQSWTLKRVQGDPFGVIATREIPRIGSRFAASWVGVMADVGIIMGSRSDWETMRHAAEILDALVVGYETRIVSAHRTPERLYDYARTAAERGLKVIIAGAGGAAHLPGMAAAMTWLPVLGVPVESKALSGMDSLLSIVQMPGGVPVGTLAIGKPGAINAGLLAASILAVSDEALAGRLEDWRRRQTDSVSEQPE